MHQSVPPLTRRQLTCISSLSTLTISTPRLKSFPSRMQGTSIPTIEVHTVWKFLSTLKCTTSGPDELPFWIWRDYAYQLVPTITKVFNSSLKKRLVPCLRKLQSWTKVVRHSTKKTFFVKRVRFSMSNFDISTPLPLFNVVTRLKCPWSVLQH